jgi:hypothetical protein
MGSWLIWKCCIAAQEFEMIRYFQRLGGDIERAWSGESYNEEIFSQIVFDTLKLAPPSDYVEVSEIIDWIFGSFQEFQQPSHRDLFGEPPIMLFQAPRFYIEVLFWLSGTTEIHEHAFSGVFAVLAGSSVHSHWRFVTERTINSRMLTGRLERVSTELLSPGSMRPIHSGDRLIHQLFHLNVPSVTIVVRTYQDRDHLPQYKYLPPGLAIDPEDRDGRRTRRLMLLDGMARGQIDGLRKYARSLVDTCEMETLYYMFSTLTRRQVDKGFLEELYGIARQRHGEVVDLFRQACDGARRTRIVTALRSKVSDPDARFLLALLMLLPDRDAIFQAIHLRFPDAEPLAVIETWLEAMSGRDTIGFDFNDVNRLIFRGLVNGLDMEGLLERLRSDFREDSIDTHRDRLLDHAKQLAKSDLFYPLLSRSPLREETQGV